MELRPYQEEARRSIHAQWQDGFKRTLLVLPTGTGKTVVFSKVIEDVVRDGGRALVLAHRGELLDQAADKLAQATGLGCAVEKAESSSLGEWYRVTVGSIQTLMRDKRLQAFEPEYFSHIVVDEAHHVLAESYLKVLAHFGEAHVLGVTATADRGDKKNLGKYFNSLAYEYTLPAAIKDGYLSRIEAQTIPLTLDISEVGMSAGDFKAGDLGTALDPYLANIASEMVSAGCLGRKTVVFLPLIKTAQKFRDLLTAQGFAAAEVNGESKDRAEVLRDFDAGKYNVLCNSMLLTEGWDQPDVDCIVVLRPTKIRSLYCQMVGRGTRTSPGKDNLLLLDFLWHTARHELCHPANLIAQTEEVACKMTETLAASPGYPVDIEVAEKQAQSDVVREREEALAKKLRELKDKKRRLVDPLQFELSIEASDLLDYTPEFGWEVYPPTESQLSALEGWGIDPSEIANAGLASKLLNRLQTRRDSSLSTPKQIRQLEGRGFQHVGTWSMSDASAMISRIAANGWKTPRGIIPSEYVPSFEGVSYV